MSTVANHSFARFIPALVMSVMLLGAPAAAQVAMPTFTPIETPTTARTSVFVDQIGERNSTSIEQTSPAQKATISQDGSDNMISLEQNDGGPHIAVVGQDGDGNEAGIAQSGLGETIANLRQTGDGNSVLLAQSNNGTIATAAEIVQSGSSNSIELIQDGEDNQARLTQNGDNNTLTASQLGAGNRLEWVQDGSGLSDMTVEQTGGQAMYILQTNM